MYSKITVCCTAKAYQSIPMKHHLSAEMQCYGSSLCLCGRRVSWCLSHTLWHGTRTLGECMWWQATTQTKGEWGRQQEEPCMAMGWKNGVMPALCNGERCLDKSWLCLLTHLPCSGAAASVFQARVGGKVSLCIIRKAHLRQTRRAGKSWFPCWDKRTILKMQKPERSKLRVEQNQTKPNQTWRKMVLCTSDTL